MVKRILAAAAVSGILVLGGSLAASAVDVYPEDVTCTSTHLYLNVGETATISCVGLPAGATVAHTVTGPGVTSASLASIVRAVDPGTHTLHVTASDAGETSVTLTAAATGEHVITVSVDGTVVHSMSVHGVDPAAGNGGAGAEASGSTGALPVTGGSISPAAIWIGVGALALGGGAVGVAVARRRQQS